MLVRLVEKMTMELPYLVLLALLALAWCGGLQVLVRGILQDEGGQLVTHVNIAGVTASNASLRDHLLLYGHNLHRTPKPLSYELILLDHTLHTSTFFFFFKHFTITKILIYMYMSAVS